MAMYDLISGSEFFRVAVIWAACPEEEGEGKRKSNNNSHESLQILLFLAAEEVLGREKNTSPIKCTSILGSGRKGEKWQTESEERGNRQGGRVRVGGTENEMQRED